MLYNAIKRLIEKKQTEGLAEKLDVFLLLNRISTEEYKELSAMISGGAE